MDSAIILSQLQPPDECWLPPSIVDVVALAKGGTCVQQSLMALHFAFEITHLLAECIKTSKVGHALFLFHRNINPLIL